MSQTTREYVYDYDYDYDHDCQMQLQLELHLQLARVERARRIETMASRE